MREGKLLAKEKIGILAILHETPMVRPAQPAQIPYTTGCTPVSVRIRTHPKNL
jgi:hypothetical protein